MSPGRRRAQSGTTLVELLVSITIISIALVLIIGALSDGVLQTTIEKRNVTVEAVQQYEMDKVLAAQFDPNAQPYSDCFATDNQAAPMSAAGYQGGCASGYALRADVTWSPYSGTVQLWTITITSLALSSQVGSPLSVLKSPHQ